MNRISEVVLNFLLNATWQIGAIALVSIALSRLLRNVAARYRHALWVVGLLLCVALPIWSVFDFSNETPVVTSPRATSRIHSPVETSEQTPQIAANVSEQSTGTGSTLGKLMHRQNRPVAVPPVVLIVLVMGYGLFILYRLTRLLQALLNTKRLTNSAYESRLSIAMAAALERCKAALGVNRVELCYSRSVMFPVTLGARRPLIVLPELFLVEQTRETLEAVLGHELAHIARGDWVLNLFLEFIWLPISFHPFANFIKRQVDKTRELACDDMVTERVVEPVSYARTLLRVAGTLSSPVDRALTLGMFDTDILEERIMKLARNNRQSSARGARLLTMSAFLVLCLIGMSISTFSFDLRLENGAKQPGATATTNGSTTQIDSRLSANDSQSIAQDEGKAKRSLDELIKGIGSADPEERATAACGAGRNRDVELIPALIAMLGDDARIKPMRCWENGSWNPALNSFKQPSPGEQAAIALASMGTPAFEPLTRSLSNGNASVRRNAAWAIGELTNMAPGERTEAVLPLISLLTDSDEWVRAAAAQGLGELRDDRAGDGLIAALSDGFVRVREVAAWALSELKYENAVPALCKVLIEDAQPDVRETAAMALGEIKSPKAVVALKQALLDPEQRVRENAAEALAEIEDSDG